MFTIHVLRWPLLGLPRNPSNINTVYQLCSCLSGSFSVGTSSPTCATWTLVKAEPKHSFFVSIPKEEVILRDERGVNVLYVSQILIRMNDFCYLLKYALQNANHGGFWLFCILFPYFSIPFQIFVDSLLPLVSSWKSLFIQVKQQSFMQAFDTSPSPLRSKLSRPVNCTIPFSSVFKACPPKIPFLNTLEFSGFLFLKPACICFPIRCELVQLTSSLTLDQSPRLSLSTQTPKFWGLEASYNHPFPMGFISSLVLQNSTSIWRPNIFWHAQRSATVTSAPFYLSSFALHESSLNHSNDRYHPHFCLFFWGKVCLI